MQTEQFTLQNIKCAGCASTIHDALMELTGVTGVETAIDTGIVTVRGEALSRPQLSARLAALGYPEA